ncbi:hypothetical protein [Blastochloris sulfoviridis]|uniref:Uncharacterized protein n=1 Tax=Blastochloris sulfoviridis TaxID=50712 RepID=A0A5M6HST5_9HYPH|nr:hypothetical protein [Blastochloris sulfoviridis]KAA5598984.1 hypothetical protein F1193_12835 [Blastochloris sulfoviridis]
MALILDRRKPEMEAQAPNRGLPNPRYEAETNVADYIAEVSAELSIMAYRNSLPMLAYILDMARLEAESHADKQKS